MECRVWTSKADRIERYFGALETSLPKRFFIITFIFLCVASRRISWLVARGLSVTPLSRKLMRVRGEMNALNLLAENAANTLHNF